ncbi:MAG: hypothetical protein E5X80_22275 [Mesorhizobium sp.]|nr:MAG: hypothetical protein EOR71_21670 [Mesorhizobium sp.]TIO51893.1 MAG: hypothetical protein E5X78_15205 [Mesorhizobium sp.]TIO58909.1 MAG: hypothetical protein E5X79_19220 [Mesorhizobium sp.]TJV60807.1 MAG: hypothetical protein E5X80_22275 [Mesorhizobium sp.]
MITDAKMSAEMMKTAKSIKHCIMIATDAKGKKLLDRHVDQAGHAECEKSSTWHADAGFVRAGICGKVGREMAGCRRSFAPPVCAERRRARRQAPVPGQTTTSRALRHRANGLFQKHQGCGQKSHPEARCHRIGDHPNSQIVAAV